MPNPLNPALANATHVKLLKNGEEFEALVFSRCAEDGSEVGTPTTIAPSETLKPYVLDGWVGDVFNAMRAFPGTTDPRNGRRRLDQGVPHDLDPVGAEALVTVYLDRPMLAVSVRDEDGPHRHIGWSNQANRDKIDLQGLQDGSPPTTVVAYAEWLLETVFHPFTVKARYMKRDPYVLAIA